MKPILPRPLLWTEIKAMDEFLKGERFAELLYNNFHWLQKYHSLPVLDELVFFNELYYQLTRYYYEKPKLEDYPRYVADIKKSIGHECYVDLLLTMMYHYCRLQNSSIELLLTDRFLQAIVNNQYENKYWSHFLRVELQSFVWKKSIICPQKPCPVAPETLEKADLDWKAITRDFDSETIQELLGLWEKEEDRRKVAEIIKGKSSTGVEALEQEIKKLKEKNSQISAERDEYMRQAVKMEETLEIAHKEIQNSTEETKKSNEQTRQQIDGIYRQMDQLVYQHIEDYARMSSGFGSPVVEIYESDRPVVHHMTNISNVNFNPLPTAERKASLPGVLATDQAKIYWERLKQKKFVDGRFMLAQSTTRQQAAYIAEAFAEKLEIKAKWKTFQEFWNIKNLAQEIYKMKQIGKLPSRSKEIDAIFED